MDAWLLNIVYKFEGYGILLYVLITTVISTLLAAVIGIERHIKGEFGGVRMHVLLSIG